MIKTIILNSIAAVALVVANAGVGINCYGFLYQPKYPKVKK
ncbi:AgrD family cyclic lactone autoinducer peptide [Alkaliphilus peptidifermentans]|uniref:Cyclic lactone autoinducer peptide n=1 Tax=Alkaliphilus peptidifermentans DSM 18978 TaxID=1120976 RepID=A0A1G5GIN2_9FIRM|nr:cyclic lactone autoinducer peptide [Alkaliphilus peptidifermentans]SCY50558.1 cyclic lactone autoinducer peptide [Alkaliphilus peptidifermentans DSM 18978]